MRVHLNLKFKDLIKILVIGFIVFVLYSSCDTAFAISQTPNSDYGNYIADYSQRYLLEGWTYSQDTYNPDFTLQDYNQWKRVRDSVISNYIENPNYNFNYYVLAERWICTEFYDSSCNGNMNNYTLFLFETEPDLSFYSYYSSSGSSTAYHYWNNITFDTLYNHVCVTEFNNTSNLNVNWRELSCNSSDHMLDIYTSLRNNMLLSSAVDNGSLDTSIYDLGPFSSPAYNRVNKFTILDKNFNIPYQKQTGTNIHNYQIAIPVNSSFQGCKTGVFGSDCPVYYYDVDDNIPSVFETLFSIPTISFSNLTPYKDNNDNIYKYTLDVGFSIFNTSSYTYQYLSPNSSDWENITSNNSSLELQENGAYYFRIIDNATNDIVRTSSYNILDISVQAPFIKTDISTPDSCKVPYDNEILTVCKRLSLEPSYYGSDYKFQYSLDNGSTWTELFSRYSFLVSKGDIVPLRVIDNDNNVLWSKTLEFDFNLDTIPDDIGIFVTFNDTYWGLQGSKKFYSEIYIYNLDSNLINNVYISYDGFTWSLLDLTNYSSYYFATTRNYEQNLTFYIKILDSNDDVIYTNSHYVNLNTEDVNDIVGYLENFNRNMRGPISSVITAPLRLVNLLKTGDLCQPLQLPFAHIGNIGIPCMRQVFEQNLPDYLTIYQLISTGFVGYFCCLTMIRTIKTLVRPDDDRIEVVDL